MRTANKQVDTVNNEGEATLGRPRDPDVERRALESALRIFTAKGWFGFTIGAVSQEAKVGKSSIYLRWGSREQLLMAAFTECGEWASDQPGEGLLLRDWLLAYLVDRVSGYWSLVGQSVMRLQIEYQANADQFRNLWEATVGVSTAALRQGLTDAQQRGELAPDFCPQAVSEALEGAALIKAATTPVDQRAAVGLGKWAAQLLGQVIDPWLSPIR